jgi:hypothetical protein
MKPGDTIKRVGDPYSWAPIGFITKCCLDPNEPNPELVDITKPYGVLGYTALDGSFVFIYGMDNWEVVDGEPPLYFNRIDYSAPDIVVPNVKEQAGVMLTEESMAEILEDMEKSKTLQDQKDKLYDIVIKWRDENNVWDGEVIALYDHVRETFDDLVHELIRTVGYAPYKEEDQ